jgi:hypothetical protein
LCASARLKIIERREGTPSLPFVPSDIILPLLLSLHATAARNIAKDLRDSFGLS